MKRLIVSIAATLALAAVAMPTNDEVKKAVPTVKELMNPLVAEFRSRKKSAVEVGETAMAYAKEADTEGAKFLLLKGAVWYFAQAKDDAKAVAAIAALGEQVKDLPPEVLRNDILKPAIDHVSEQNVPGLFAQFRSASAQMEIAKLASSIRRNRADEPTRRRYAELLVVTGDWKAALDIFAKLDDAKVVQAAKDEIGGTTLAPAGDFWWNYTPTEATAADAIKAHAVALYRKAIAAGELTGLKKVVAEKRIASVPFADSFNVSARESGTLAASGTPRGSGTLAASGTPRGSGTLAASKALYCVIDLSAGPDASKYPVSYLAAEPKGGWTDEYKTKKLVLRRIEPGKFKMGGEYEVTLTKPFYCGVFEVTQKQYDLVTGNNPSQSKGDMRPVEKVSWNMIRGDSSTYNWPSSVKVDSNSFMGKIQARTGLNFDLPTEAQWEYTCRAGTTSKYNNGGDTEVDLKKLGRCKDNRADGKGGYADAHTTTVGSYQPNAWGVYDMHGNVWEWCLDWHGNLSSSVTDPLGASSGEGRVDRGGCWWNYADRCTSSYRSISVPSSVNNGDGSRGFRLCMNPEGSVGAIVRGRATPTATSSKELPVATSKRPDQLTLDLGGGVKMEMVGCPSGQFTKIVKQVPANQRWRGAKTVEVTRPFWIGKYPVTIGEWERLMPKVKPLPGVKAKDMDPKVPVQILRNDCMGDVSRKTMEEFMDKLTRKFKRQLPPGYIFRLPTDAEWVFAIRANASDPNDPFCSGEPPKDRVLESYVLYEDSEQYWLERGCDPSLFNKKDLLAPYIPVGQRKPNAWGIYDMGGCTPECMLDLGEGNPFADDLKDPLVLNDDPSKPQSARLRYGFKTKKEVVGSEGNFLARGGPFGGGPISWRGAWNVQYNLRFGSATRAVKLRLVVGPDLLKERGITPPPPDSK